MRRVGGGERKEERGDFFLTVFPKRRYYQPGVQRGTSHIPHIYFWTCVHTPLLFLIYSS